MDEEISGWVMEYLLQHSPSDLLVKAVLSKIPISNNDTRLKKLILLRSIQSEISDRLVSEMILECLEMMEKLENKEGKRIMSSMKMAYCAVAVECTVKYLVSVDSGDWYFEALTRIWRGRIENLTDSVLVTDELAKWRNDLEAAVYDTEVRDRLVNKNTRIDALRLVEGYLGEARAMMGPTYLELAAGKMSQSKEKETETDVGVVKKLERRAEMVVEEASSDDGVGDIATGVKEKGVLKNGPNHNQEPCTGDQDHVQKNGPDSESCTKKLRYCM